MLRIASFTVTQLPAPNYHCRGGEATAVREMPPRWWGHVAVDLKRQVHAPGCPWHRCTVLERVEGWMAGRCWGDSSSCCKDRR